MKKVLLAAVASTMIALPVLAADVKLGVIYGFTGPIE